jgi:hypothetical protein
MKTYAMTTIGPATACYHGRLIPSPARVNPEASYTFSVRQDGNVTTFEVTGYQLAALMTMFDYVQKVGNGYLPEIPGAPE